ncbi:MAG: copper-translocating P-type ATPase [Planctomycetota bacterium]
MPLPVLNPNDANLLDQQALEAEPAVSPEDETAARSCCGGTPRSSLVPDDPDAVYTCPMDPEVEQIGPGACPVCGMDLEPKFASADDTAERRAIGDMQRRFGIAAVLSLPVLLLAMGPMIGIQIDGWLRPLVRWDRSPSLVYGQAMLTLGVLCFGGWPLLKRGFESFKGRNWNMFTLITIGTLVAYGYSLFAVVRADFMGDMFAADGSFIGSEPAVYFESTAVIITLVLLGQVLELRARRRTGDAIRALIGLTPDTTIRVRVGIDEEISVDEVVPGDRLRILPGARVPVDGRVVVGETRIDESMLTGEWKPVAKQIGDDVSAGTLNHDGSVLIESTRVGRETILGRMVQRVAEAQRSRAPVQALVDRVAAFFVPTVLIAALLALIGWLIFPATPSLPDAILAAVSVLIIACPCALGLATPMSIMVAMGRGAKQGILVRDAETLQRLETIDTVLFDKTGTLTEGKPAIVAIHLAEQHKNASELTEERLLQLAAAVERHSEHPIAKAITAKADSEPTTRAIAEASDVQVVPGNGIRRVVGDQPVAIGKREWLRSVGAGEEAGFDQFVQTHQAGGSTLVFVAIDQRIVAALAINDTIRETTPQAIRRLSQSGIQIEMLSGDHLQNATVIANALLIETVRAGLSPDAKLERMVQLQRQGRRVAMVGDGINDAAALAAADVGIAMGSGTDVAMESADLTLLGGVEGVVESIELGRSTMRNIRQNLGFAFGYNALGIPIAAGVLTPLTGWQMSPMLAAAAMSLSSVSVIANALRLRRYSRC